MLLVMRQRLAENGVFLLRVGVSLLMLSHGIPKALEYDTLVQTFPDPLNVGTEMSAMLILIAMMVAVFVHHFNDPWAMRELPLLYAIVYGCLSFTGPGSLSIDGWFAKTVFETKEPASPTPPRAQPGAPT